MLENYGHVKEKQTSKTCLSRKKKRVTLRINQEKRCLVAFL